MDESLPNLNEIKSGDWLKVWSGRWSLLSDSYFADCWTSSEVLGKPAFPRVAYIYKNQITDCWIRSEDKDDLGKRLVGEARKDRSFLPGLSDSLIDQADTFHKFIKKNPKIGFDKNKYDQFWKIIDNYYLPHLCVKYIVDYLSEEELAISFQLLEGARIYAEPVFREAENYIEEFAGELSKKFQTDKKLILASTGEEAVSYLSGSKPDEEILKGRLTSIALFASWSDRSLFLGPLADSLGAALESTDNDQLGGQTAYKGKVIGKVKVIFDPVAEAHKVEEGDILVTGMTRPEYLPIMKKASAFITDAGGMLCHAAITARELKKPCIIGTKIATKILKDGDVVEVDAERGIVRKI